MDTTMSSANDSMVIDSMVIEPRPESLCEKPSDAAKDESLVTLNDYLKMVQTDGSKLGKVPLKYRTSEICWTAVQRDGMSLQFVPKNLTTPELYLAAVQENGLALGFIPMHERSYKLSVAAVQRDGISRAYVPVRFHNRNLDAMVNDRPRHENKYSY